MSKIIDSNNVMQARDINKISAGQKVRFVLAKTGTYAFLLIMALIILFPFYWMIISSLKDLNEYRQAIPTFWPKKMMFGNYAEAVTGCHFDYLGFDTVTGGGIGHKYCLAFIATYAAALIGHIFNI